MTILLHAVFWVNLFFLFHKYTGGTIVAWDLVKLSPNSKMYVYNEEKFIENQHPLVDRPKDRRQIVLIINDSINATQNITSDCHEIKFLQKPERSRITAASKLAALFAKDRYPVFMIYMRNTVFCLIPKGKSNLQ